MSTVLRRNRKGSDSQIVRSNAVGYSLATVAGKIGCHPTSVTLRLQSLEIPPADTRRSFMESILEKLPEEHVELLADELTAGFEQGQKPRSVKDYVQSLIEQDLAAKAAALSSQGAYQNAAA